MFLPYKFIDENLPPEAKQVRTLQSRKRIWIVVKYYLSIRFVFLKSAQFMSQNNPHRTSPRFNSSSANNTFNLTASNFNTRNSPTRMSGKRNKIFSTSSQDPDCVAAAASILSQSDLNNIHPNNMQFYLQKLDLLYQNLEGRIQKLENILSEQIFGVDSGVINPNNSHFNAIINAHPSIDNSSTSGNNFEFNPATIVPSNCSTSSTSSICSILEPVPKEISVIIIKK